ncbi:MAG: hypothetical protein ABIO45_18165 [Burkholderiaceae bacterium]
MSQEMPVRIANDLKPCDLVSEMAGSLRVGDAVLQLFDDLGFAKSDFVIQEEPHSILACQLGLLGGLLRVQCRSTDEDRLYSTGRGSTWMAAILGDLDDGHFARARRRQAMSASVPSSRVAILRERQQHGHDDFADTAPDVRLPFVHGAESGPVWSERPRKLAIQAGLGGF